MKKYAPSDFELLLRGIPEKMEDGDERALIVIISSTNKTNPARKEHVEKLVLHNMREAFFYARHVSKGHIPDGEVLTTCYSAVLGAANNVKPSDNRFFAFAKPWIRGALSRYWKTKDVVKNSSLHETPDFEPEPDKVTATCDGNESFEPLEADHAEPDFDRIELAEKLALVKPMIKSRLNDQEQMVIELYYTSGFTFSKIGEMLGVTRSAIEHTHARALKKLRSALARHKELFQ